MDYTDCTRFSSFFRMGCKHFWNKGYMRFLRMDCKHFSREAQDYPQKKLWGLK
jgi:hypothetical protein